METSASQALRRLQVSSQPPTWSLLCGLLLHQAAPDVELDGSQHGEPGEERKDGARTSYLSEQGYRVIRFLNEQVNRELDEVLEAIYAALTEL